MLRIHMRSGVWVRMFGLAVSAIVLAGACGGGPAQTTSGGALSQNSIRLVTSSVGFFFAPAYIAQQLGYFRTEGVNVTISSGGGGPNAVAALIGGGADIGAIGVGNMSHAVENGQNLVFVGSLLLGLPGWVTVNRSEAAAARISATSTLRDRVLFLKGKAIGVNSVTGSSGLSVKYLLNQQGLGVDAVSLISLPSQDAMLLALKAGKIGAFRSDPPLPEIAESEGFGLRLIDSGASVPGLSNALGAGFAVTPAFLRSHGDTVRAFLRAVERALLLTRSDPSKARDAFYEFLAAQGQVNAVPEPAKQSAWQDAAAAIPKTVTMDGTAWADPEIRKLFGIPPSFNTDALIDNSIANKVATEVR